VPSKHNPAESLADIIENFERIETYVLGMDRTAFAADGLVREPVERFLERAREPAHRLGEEANVLVPRQAWGDIRGMGSRLRHAYDRISLNVIWNAVRYDLRGLGADACDMRWHSFRQDVGRCDCGNPPPLPHRTR
jgi:uncharacterized protein with HEPN domain